MIGQKVVTGLDIGTSSIVAALARIDRLGRISSVEIVQSRSEGIDRGLLTDLEKLTTAIQSVIQSLQSKTKTKISDVYININGNYITTRHSHAAIPLLNRANNAVGLRDIRKVNNQARLLGLKLEEEVIHEFPQSYTIDEHNKVKNPLGLYGRKLEVDLYLILSRISQIDNLVKSVNQAGLEVTDIELSGLATSLAILDAKKRQEGCILIDIGAGTTEILIFKDNVLREVAILSFAGNDITEAIVSKFKLPFELAEDIKKSYGLACSKDVKDNREVLIKQNSAYKPIQQKLICELIESKVGKLISLIKTKINNSAYRGQINSGIVITGGTALLPGLLEKIESELGIPVRLGRIKNVNFPATKMPLYATAIGLIHYGIDKSINKHFKLSTDKNLFFRFLDRVKEVYQEYF